MNTKKQPYESYSDNGTPNSNEVDPQVTSKQNNKHSQEECYKDNLDCYESAPTQLAAKHGSLLQLCRRSH